MIPSVPASAENCGSKLISALVSATRNVLAGSAASARHGKASGSSAVPTIRDIALRRDAFDGGLPMRCRGALLRRRL